MELFIARVAYSNLDDKKVTESYLVDALSYTEAEAKVLDHLASFSLDGVEIKSLKPIGVSEAIGLDVDGESYRYYIIGLTDGKGKTTSRECLSKSSPQWRHATLSPIAGRTWSPLCACWMW